MSAARLGSMAAEMKPAYLVSGDDEGKIADARRRFRARAERDGGVGSLEIFEGGDGRRAPDADAFIAGLDAFSLTASRRYLLVDGAGGWGKADAERVADALARIPEETTVGLFCSGKAPAKLVKAVEKAGGDALTYEAPKARELPGRLAAEARELGFKLDNAAARMLVERMGARPARLRTELERLALWAGSGGSVTADDLEAMIADTSEQAIWSLADAIVEGDAAQTLAVAERLVAQGEPLPKIIYSLAPRLRQALHAARRIESGASPKEVAGELKMHPYAAKMLVGRVKDRTVADIATSIGALADLELWSRGGSDYAEPVAFTLSLRRAVGLEDEPAQQAAGVAQAA